MNRKTYDYERKKHTMHLFVFAMICLLFTTIYGCPALKAVFEDQNEEYGCWCKSYRLSKVEINGEIEAVDDWDEICKKHVQCYINSSESTWTLCDSQFLINIFFTGAKNKIMPIGVKNVFEYYWQDHYQSEIPESFYNISGSKIYFYNKTKKCVRQDVPVSSP